MKTLKQMKNRADKLYSVFTIKEFDNGDKRVIIDTKDSELERQALDLTYYVSTKASLSMDSVYNFTQEALGLISDSEAKTIDELREVDIEPSVYTSSLTEWLNESNHHVYYLTEALQVGFDDGFGLLGYAEQLAREEVYNLVIDWFEEQL